MRFILGADLEAPGAYRLCMLRERSNSGKGTWPRFREIQAGQNAGMSVAVNVLSTCKTCSISQRQVGQEMCSGVQHMYAMHDAYCEGYSYYSRSVRSPINMSRYPQRLEVVAFEYGDSRAALSPCFRLVTR